MPAKIPRECLERVRKLYLAGRSDAQIQSTLSREWGVTCRCIRRYIKIERDKFAKRDERNAPAAHARANEMFLEIYRRARKAGDLKTMAVAAHRLAELHGAIGPKRIEVTGKDGEPIQSHVARVVMMPQLDEQPAPDGDLVAPTSGTTDPIPRVDGG